MTKLEDIYQCQTVNWIGDWGHILIIMFNWLDNQTKCNNQDVTPNPLSCWQTMFLEHPDLDGVDLSKKIDNNDILDMKDVLNILQSVSGTIQESETLKPYVIHRDVLQL